MRHSSEIRTERRRHLDLLEKARGEIHKEMLGLDDLIEASFYALIAPGRRARNQRGGSLLIEGAHGLGKTEFVDVLGRVMDLSFNRIQFVVDTDPSSITGISVWDDKKKEFVFKPGAMFANLVLADEITRASAKIQSALFEGMAEQKVTIDGVSHLLPTPWHLFGTTNIAEEIGSVLYELPMGQRDRFFMALRVEPLPENLERKLYARSVGEGVMAPPPVKRVLNNDELERVSLFISNHYPIPEGSVMNSFITRLVRATRLDKSVLYGASHRAGIDLTRAAQTAAFLADDDLVTQTHVLSVFERVMHLRILLVHAYEEELYSDRRDVAEILHDIVEQTPLFEGAL